MNYQVSSIYLIYVPQKRKCFSWHCTFHDNRGCFTRLYPSNDSRQSLQSSSRARYSSHEINRADWSHSWRSTCANSSMVVMCLPLSASQRFETSCSLEHTFMDDTAIWYHLIFVWFSKEASAYKHPLTLTLASINLTSRRYHAHAWRVPHSLRQGNSWYPCLRRFFRKPDNNKWIIINIIIEIIHPFSDVTTQNTAKISKLVYCYELSWYQNSWRINSLQVSF